MKTTLGNSDETYVLEKAFLVYRHGQGGNVDVRMHDIVSTGSDPTLGPGQFVTESYLRAIADLFIKREARFIPANVLAVDSMSTVWYEPARPRRLFFSNTSNEKVAAFNGKIVPMPALVFRAQYQNGRRLNVFALSNDARPDPASPLFTAPLWNIDSQGSLCVGTTPLPDSPAVDNTATWSDSFFASAFTHPGYTTGRLHTGTMTYPKILAAAIEKGAFDPAWLVPSTFKLQNLIDGR